MNIRSLFFLVTLVTITIPPLFAQETGNKTDQPPAVEIELPDEQTTPPSDSLPEITKMPEVIKKVIPEYPATLAQKGIQGSVILDCIVNEKGTIDSVGVNKGVHPLLDSNAVRAMRQFVFSPAMAGTVAVPVLLQYEFPFTFTEVVATLDKYVNFSGTLRERGTRTPIPDALVVVSFIDTIPDQPLPVPFSAYCKKIGSFDGQSLEEGKLVTTTDSLGNFKFYSLPACSIQVTAPVPGYEAFSQKESITYGQELTATYYLKKVSYNDYEVVVYGKAEEKEISRREITLNEVKKIPGLANDVVRVVQALPGVSRPSFGSGDVIVRGAPTWDSKFYLDGTVLPTLYHFGGLKSIYTADAVGSIDFYPGAFSTDYGGAIAGVIEIKGRPGKRDRLHGQVDCNLIDGSIFVEGPVNNKISFLASARRSFIGDLVSWYVDKNPDQFPISLTPYYYDMLARTDIELSKNNKLFFTILHSRDSLGIIVPSQQGGSSEITDQTDALGTKVQFTTALAAWDWKISDIVSNSLRYSFTKADFDMSIFGFVKVNERSYIHHIRNECTVKLSSIAELSGGADIELTDENLILIIPSGSGIINRDTTNNWLFGVVGAYANIKLQLTPDLQILPGLRYDYYPELIHKGGIVPEFWQYHSFNNNRGISGDPSFRISTRYRLNENQTLKAAIGNYNQTPKPIGQVIHKTWGDPSMPTTKAAHYLVGYEIKLTDLIHADIQGYINRQWDIPRMASSEDQKEHPGALWLPDDKGRMKGIELMLRHDDNGKFFGWLAYTLAKSERWDPHKRKYYLYGNDETHNLQLVASYHLPHEWDIGTRIRYVTGKPTTPIDRVIESEVYNRFTTTPGDLNSGRLDPFFQIDIRVDKKFVYKKWMFSTYLDIQNISWFFYKSPEMEVNNYNFTESQPVSMIILPAIGFKAEF